MPRLRPEPTNLRYKPAEQKVSVGLEPVMGKIAREVMVGVTPYLIGSLERFGLRIAGCRSNRNPALIWLCGDEPPSVPGGRARPRDPGGQETADLSGRQRWVTRSCPNAGEHWR